MNVISSTSDKEDSDKGAAAQATLSLCVQAPTVSQVFKFERHES